jgi:hypothetical protein
MTSLILDGRARTGMTLAAFHGQRAILEQAARMGVAIPPISDVDEDAPPAYAEVNPLTPSEAVARWVARCPDCPGGSSYVWIDGPHVMWCLACTNEAIAHKWRRVTVPADRLEIERLLSLRPRSSQRAWLPGETVEQLRAENESIGAEV